MEHQQQYTCPMHPEMVKPAPGKCPKCGMDLVLVEQSGNKDKNGHEDEHGHHSHITLKNETSSEH